MSDTLDGVKPELTSPHAPVAPAPTAPRDTLRETAQEFFATLARETRKPHYGHQALSWTNSLLLRAQEAGLYDPAKEPT